MNLKNSATYRREEIRPEREPTAVASNAVMYEEMLDLEYIDGLPPGTERSQPAPIHPITSDLWQASAKTRLWEFAIPPRATEDAARPPGGQGPKARGVSILGTVVVGASSTRSAAEPPFSTVPNRIRSSQPSTRAEPLLAAVPKHNPSTPSNPVSPPSTAPLLRAFDAAPAGGATWSTAQTMVARVAAVEEAEGDEGAQVEPVDPAQSGSRLVASTKLLPRPRPSSRMKRIAALVVAGVGVVGLGLFMARSQWVAAASTPEVAIADGAASAPRIPQAPVTPIAARAADEDAKEPQRSVLTHPNPPTQTLRAEPARQQPPVAPSAPSHLALDARRPLPETSAPRGVTLARQAVDALLAGDRPRALQYYRELSRAEPERQAYREAVLLLTRAASETPHSKPASDE